MIKVTVHEKRRVNEEQPLFTKKREVNGKNDQTLYSPHTITTARRTDNIPLICTGAGLIHPLHSQPMSLATETMPETRLHFCHFPAVFHYYCVLALLSKVEWFLIENSVFFTTISNNAFSG